MKQFIYRIESVRKLHNVAEEMIVIMAVNKLSCKAYEWFHSKAEYAEFAGTIVEKIWLA